MHLCSYHKRLPHFLHWNVITNFFTETQIAQTSETGVSSDTTKDKIKECQDGRNCFSLKKKTQNNTRHIRSSNYLWRTCWINISMTLCITLTLCRTSAFQRSDLWCMFIIHAYYCNPKICHIFYWMGVNTFSFMIKIQYLKSLSTVKLRRLIMLIGIPLN